MKKILAACILMLSSIATNSNAQEWDSDLRNKVLFGFKGGCNYSTIFDSKEGKIAASPKVGLAAGIFVPLPIGRYFGVQPELLFSQRGFHKEGHEKTAKFTRSISYIDVPIFFTVKPRRCITLLSGPQYSYLLRQKDESTHSGRQINQQQEFKHDNFRKNLMSIVAGFDINIREIIVAARVGCDVLNNTGNGINTPASYKNTWCQLMLGYRFDFYY